MNPLFSKESIRRLEPILREIITQYLDWMDTCGKSGEIVSMNMVYKALTSDVITTYAFGKSSNALASEDQHRALFETLEKSLGIVHWMMHIGWLSPLLEYLPSAIIIGLAPGLGTAFQQQRVNLAIQILTNEFG